jgi:hypothetical protein
MKKKQPVKEPNKAIETAEAQGRLDAFNKEMNALAEKYQVRLDINQRIVVVDAKPTK